MSALQTKKPRSFRLSQKAIDELEIMTKMEMQQAETLNITPRNATEIVERSIDTLYTVMTDECAGESYLTKMSMVISDAVNQGFACYDLAFNNLLHELAIIKEILYTQMKLGSYSKDSDLIKDIVNNKISIYQPIIEDKVNDKTQ